MHANWVDQDQDRGSEGGAWEDLVRAGRPHPCSDGKNSRGHDPGFPLGPGSSGATLAQRGRVGRETPRSPSMEMPRGSWTPSLEKGRGQCQVQTDGAPEGARLSGRGAARGRREGDRVAGPGEGQGRPHPSRGAYLNWR